MFKDVKLRIFDILRKHNSHFHSKNFEHSNVKLFLIVFNPRGVFYVIICRGGNGSDLLL